MNAIRARRVVSKVHYWAGWGLGAVALSWFASGFFMTLKPITEVRGNHIAVEPPPALAGTGYALPELDGVSSVEMIDRLGTAAFLVTGEGGRRVIDARTGDELDPPGQAAIRAKAESLLKIDSEVTGLTKLHVAPRDYAGPLPVWQVQLSEPDGTRLYIDAQTGRLVRVRTAHWRAFDVAWRIHILDPAGERISSWWLTLASGLASLFAVSGLVLLWRPRPRRS